MLPRSSSPVAVSEIGDGTTLTTALRRAGSTASRTASVSELRPLCETPNTGWVLAGNGSGWSPAPSRQEGMPRRRSSATGPRPPAGPYGAGEFEHADPAAAGRAGGRHGAPRGAGRGAVQQPGRAVEAADRDLHHPVVAGHFEQLAAHGRVEAVDGGADD